MEQNLNLTKEKKEEMLHLIKIFFGSLESIKLSCCISATKAIAEGHGDSQVF